MAGRRQTLYRVMARHRGPEPGPASRCWRSTSSRPAEAFQEDTSVVRAHRGHRLGLLMKAAMLRWVGDERPEVGAIDTWNDATNHHMIAINERLGVHRRGPPPGLPGGPSERPIRVGTIAGLLPTRS